MDVTIIIITIAIIAIFIIFAKLRDNRGTVDELRDNNRESKDINRQTSDIIDKLSGENTEAGKLNRDIESDNKTAGNIIKQIRKQKLDR